MSVLRSSFLAYSFFLAGCLLSGEACSADITKDDSFSEVDLYYLSGEIVADDGSKLKNLLIRTRNQDRPGLLLLNSDGGSVVAAYELMQQIIENNLGTIVPQEASCYSSCFLLLASGNPRGAFATSHIGVHRISIKDAESNASKGFSVDMSEVYRSLGVPPKIRLAMLETPSKEMYILTSSDIRELSTIPENILGNLTGLRFPEFHVSGQKFNGVGELLNSFIALIKSIDDRQVLEEVARIYIPEAMRLTLPYLTDKQKEFLKAGLTDFMTQLDYAHKVLESASANDDYSVNKVRRELLESFFMDILSVNPGNVSLLRSLTQNKYTYDDDRDVQGLAFADRYNELRELCRAGFCNEELVKEQERAWIRRSEKFSKIMSGSHEAELLNSVMIRNQIIFINTFKYTISSRIKDRTYIKRFDFSSYVALMNSIIEVYNMMVTNKLTASDIDQYNAVLGAYILPYIENALIDEGNDPIEVSDLSLVAGAYDLSFREFFVSSNRMLYGDSYNRAQTEYVKLEGKLARAASLTMLLLRKDSMYAKYIPFFHKCARDICDKDDDRRIFDGVQYYYKAMDDLCLKGQCNTKQFQRQKNAFLKYSRLYNDFVNKSGYVYRPHLTTCFLSWQLARMQGVFRIYSQ
jgi:hypothetical protein